MRVFISQPMSGEEEKYILATRERVKRNIFKLLGEDVEIIDNYFTDDFRHSLEMEEKDVRQFDLFWLAESLAYLSEADIIYMCDGWENSKGCNIEFECAKKYGIDICFEK